MEIQDIFLVVVMLLVQVIIMVEVVVPVPVVRELKELVVLDNHSLLSLDL